MRAIARNIGLYPGSLLRFDNAEIFIMTNYRGAALGPWGSEIRGRPPRFPIPADLGGRWVFAHFVADEVEIEAASWLEAARTARPN